MSVPGWVALFMASKWEREWTGAKFLGTFGHGVLQCHLVRKVKTSENKLQLFGWAEEMKRKVQNLQF